MTPKVSGDWPLEELRYKGNVLGISPNQITTFDGKTTTEVLDEAVSVPFILFSKDVVILESGRTKGFISGTCNKNSWFGAGVQENVASTATVLNVGAFYIICKTEPNGLRVGTTGAVELVPFSDPDTFLTFSFDTIHLATYATEDSFALLHQSGFFTLGNDYVVHDKVLWQGSTLLAKQDNHMTKFAKRPKLLKLFQAPPYIVYQEQKIATATLCRGHSIFKSEELNGVKYLYDKQVLMKCTADELWVVGSLLEKTNDAPDNMKATACTFLSDSSLDHFCYIRVACFDDCLHKACVSL